MTYREASQYTYRVDAALNVCKEYGFKSEMCKGSLDIIEMQLQAQRRADALKTFVFEIGLVITVVVAVAIMCQWARPRT